MKKKRYLALSVTTLEALEKSLEDAFPVICIEAPLYPSVKTDLEQMSHIQDYQMEEYGKKHFIMLTKLRGLNCINPDQCDIIYFPLMY